jgi:RNA polymerase sigma-70 factor (ECF subfamily)
MIQLIDACKNGNAFAQKRIYDHFVSRMFRLCKRYVTNQQDAEELLMNGFLKFFKSLDKFEYQEQNSLEVYLKRIMVNECLMFLRKTKAVQISTDSILELANETENVLHQLEAEELYQLVLSLPTGYRTVFNLYAIEGYSHAEIAQNLKISEGTSKSQLSKARALLQEKLKVLYPNWASSKRPS